MPANAWALTPSALELVLGEIARGRELIVECGSGESTVTIGRALAERGAGRVYSLEHDRRWLAETRLRLDAAGTGPAVELCHAPLHDGWYDRTIVERIPAGIGLLLVDGPPGGLRADGETRYPALPQLASKLTPGALVILDDVHRPGEQRVLERWEREHPISFARRAGERFAIGVFSAAQNPAPLPGPPLRREDR